jgi:hypothetical protein
MIWNVSSRPFTKARQTGQATFEFALALLFFIVMVSLLYQGLHFELDAFNRISLLRYRVMADAHDNQPDEEKSYPAEEIEFRPVYELTPVLLMTQDVDPTLQYGPKTFRYRKGARYTEPQPIATLPEGEFELSLWIILGIPLGTNEYKQDSRRFRDNIRITSPVWVPAYAAD